MATHVALMRDGKIEQFGSPHELVAAPASTFVATFIGTPPANVLPAQVRNGRLCVAGHEVASSTQPDGREVWAMYRAESLRLDHEGPFVLDVLETSPMAGRWVLSGTMAGRRVSVATADDPRAGLGSRVRVALPARPDAVFAESGYRLDDDVPRR